jgi:microcystin degradation protein MlrC
MNRPLKVAMAGMATESCSYSPVPTRYEDFQVYGGEDLLRRYPFTEDLAEVQFIPLSYAYSVPGGPVDAKAYLGFREGLTEALEQQGPWDGVYLDMHGAMYVQGMEDAEDDWLRAVRDAVGSDCLISASYDLHGNLSEDAVGRIDLLTACRTAPHVDQSQTRERACRMLHHCLRLGRRLCKAFIPIPVALPGERVMTTSEPARSLFRQIPGLVKRARLLDASILVGYAWADEPRNHASVVAFGQEERSVQAVARRLAEAYWAARHDLDFEMPTGTVDECITQALSLRRGPVFISDAGDNVTGGAPGDVPHVAQRLLALGASHTVYASITDPEAVCRCYQASPGDTVDLAIGGKLDRLHGSPLRVTGRITALDSSTPGNREAVIEVEGVRIVLTEKRTAFTTRAQFEQLGIVLSDCRIVCVKLGYLFPDLRKAAWKSLLAFSPGALNPEITAIPFRRIRRPLFPFDPQMSWAPP